MKKIYSKPKAKRIVIDNQISLVMLTNEGTPPGGPFGSEIIIKKKENPFKA